jgi:hypothetical protein
VGEKGKKMKAVAVAMFFAAKFAVSMSGVDGGFATAPPDPKTETEMSMVVGTAEGKENDGSDKSE